MLPKFVQIVTRLDENLDRVSRRLAPLIAFCVLVSGLRFETPRADRAIKLVLCGDKSMFQVCVTMFAHFLGIVRIQHKVI